MMKKEGLSMLAYIAKENRMNDTLATAGEIVSEGEVILTILGGLGMEYEVFVTLVTTRLDPSMTFLTYREC